MYNREYAVPYISESRGASIAINDELKMNDFHLCAAVQKMRRKLAADGVSERDLDTFEALCRECGYRDLNPAYKGGKSPDDPRVPVRPGDQRTEMPEAFPDDGPADEGFA